MTDPRTGGDELRERLRPYMRNGKGEMRGNVHVPIGVAVYLRRTGQWAIPADLVDDVLACLDSHSPQDTRDDAWVRKVAAAAVQTLADSDPDGPCIEAQDLLQGTAAESYFVVSAATLEDIVYCAISNQLYDDQRFATPDSEPSGDVPAEWLCTVCGDPIAGAFREGPRRHISCEATT